MNFPEYIHQPRPWLRPAFDNTKGKAVKVFGEKIWKKVKELAKKN